MVVTGDATSLTTVDFNRDDAPDFLIGRNNSNPLTFQNQAPGTDFVAVRLDSVNNGRDLLNAKIRADFSDGTCQLHEFRSSDGYLSQSAPILFIGNRKSLNAITIRWPDGSIMDYPIKP